MALSKTVHLTTLLTTDALVLQVAERYIDSRLAAEFGVNEILGGLTIPVNDLRKAVGNIVDRTFIEALMVLFRNQGWTVHYQTDNGTNEWIHFF